MCGICGEWRADPESGRVTYDSLGTMCGVLRHRGPDGQGFYLNGQGKRRLQFGEDPPSDAGEWQGRVGLGHRRLNIIDLSTGAQPLSNEDRTVWIVFNGEIYNYRELRRRLEALGHEFATRSDTEVIVHLYEDHLDRCVSFLNGMFAFAIWDERRQRLFLARDRFGIKPLFYCWDGRRLLFGSEIKAILAAGAPRELDADALHDYLSLNYIPGPGTIYRNIRKLQPGCILTGDRGGLRPGKYWELPLRADSADGGPRSRPEADVAAELLHRLRGSVAAHMISDVPLGVFLSGGLDSSAVVALMSEVSDRPVRTFSIGFEEESFDETPKARLVASLYGTDHKEFVVRPVVRDLLPVLVGGFDEPFADSSAIPTYYVSRLAREDVTVALAGDGGDEVFAGYETYVASRLACAYARIPMALRKWGIETVVRRIPVSEGKVGFDYKAKKFVEGAGLPVERAHYSWKAIFSEDVKARLYDPGFRPSGRESFRVFAERFEERRGGELLDRLQYADVKVYLPDDILVKVDRMSMAHSLEVRVPYLDHELVEFVFSLPSRLRLRGLTKKYILKKAIGSHLPPGIVGGRKRGFNVPIGRWLRTELREMVGDCLSESEIRRQGVFDGKVVTDMIRRHNDKIDDCSRNIWGLLMFSIWFAGQNGAGLACHSGPAEDSLGIVSN